MNTNEADTSQDDIAGTENMLHLYWRKFKRPLRAGYHLGQLPNGPVDSFYDGKRGRGQHRQTRATTRNIKLETVVDGWAWIAEIYSFEQKKVYLDAQRDARRHRHNFKYR